MAAHILLEIAFPSRFMFPAALIFPAAFPIMFHSRGGHFIVKLTPLWTKFATPIIHAIYNFKIYDIFSTYT